jgi:putative ABC transport system ATP-binding protein
VSVLQATSLSKVFGSGTSAVTAVSDASISVDACEVVLLLGPSGSGKTTLVSMIGGLLTPTAGSVHIEGIGTLDRAADLAAARLRTIGFVFQTFNLLPSLSAAENVALPLRLLGVNRRVARDRAEDLLDALGLTHRRSAAPATMSGGEKQRVSLARALVTRPRVLLADEPTASLDTRRGREAMELLRDSVRQAGLACIVVTHDTRLIDFADRVMHIEDGRIVDGALTDGAS